ncbi:MAG: thioredoxin family protein [Candidatus Bathyarchaeota archaeon]|nr:MAG: thioredoxin family protein [Candidatus Bathyarchaeota archaeon]
MKAVYNIESLRNNSETVSDYLSSAIESAPRLAKRLREYNLDETVADKLKRYSEEAIIFAFSAEWCPDCYSNIPVLKLISDVTGIEVRVFGHLMRDAKNPNERWRIPPSPPEVKEFDVVKIPLIVVLDNEGRRIGEVIENPPERKTLEEALLDILEGD